MWYNQDNMTKIVQDQSKCIGCLACVGFNSTLGVDLFAADETTGLAKLQDAQVDGSRLSRDLPEGVDASMLPDVCCGGAISLE